MPRCDAPAIQHDIDGDERCATRCTPEAPVAARVWTTHRCLVAPSREARQAGFADAEAASAAAGWPIVRRRSGGLTVPNGRGVLNLTIARLVEHPGDPATQYHLLCGLIADVLWRHGARARTGSVPGAFCDGQYNVVVGARKLAGTAQRWARRSGGAGTIIIAHALILVDVDVDATVAAVNNYYGRLGRPSQFSASALVTLAALGIDGERFEADLREAAADLCAPPEGSLSPNLPNPRLERI